MADNYLENQYEQYQARKAAWERERKYGKKKKKSAYPHPLPQQKDAEDVLSVPDEDVADIMCTNWKDKSQEIYEFVMKHMIT